MEITTASKNKGNKTSRRSSIPKRSSDVSDFSDDLLQYDQEHQKSSFRSFQSSSSSELDDLTMAFPRTNSPSKPCRSRKIAMVVKKQPSCVTDIEGELTDFLGKQKSSKVAATKSADDGTISTTSLTSKSNNNNKDKDSALDNGKIEVSLRTNTTAASSRDNSLKDSDLTQWDWSHHSNDWMNIQSSSEHGFEQSFAEFPDLAIDEHLHTLNDGSHHDLGTQQSPRKPRSSRRIQRQQEFQHALSQSFNNGEMQKHRRLGEETMKRPSTTRPRRSSLNPSGLLEDCVAPPPTMADSKHAQQQQRRRSGTSSRRGSRTTERRSHHKELDRVRGKSRDNSRHTSSRDEPRESRRIRSKSRDKAQEMSSRTSSRSKSRDNSGRRRSGSPLPRPRSTSRDKSRDGSGHYRSSSPRPRRGSRRMSGSHQSSDRYREELTAPFSPGPRRGRRRSSIGSNAAAVVVQEDDRLSRSEHGHKQHYRTARRRSLDTSFHSYTSNSTNNLSEQSSRHRHRSRSNTNKQTQSPSKSMDRSARSHRSDELLPQRLSNLLGRGNNSQLEKLVLELLVAEGDNDLDLDAVEKLPTHMLDPSKVPLNIKW